MADVDAFVAVEIGRRAIQLEDAGRDILHMEYGQPSAPVPHAVTEAVKGALDRKVPGYWESAALKERIADEYARAGVAAETSQIFLMCGASPALVMALNAAFAPGARIAMARPGYVAYRNTVRGLGYEAVELDCPAEVKFQLTPAIVEALDPVPDGLIIASPANPTGSIIPPADLRQICEICDRKGIRMISDEIYHKLSYAEETPSVAAFSARAIVLNSFSKYYCLPGWRIGWMLVPDELIDAVNARQTNYFLTAPSLSQTAALAAFDAAEELDAHVETYRANRAKLLEAMPALGFTGIAPPDGAFYIYTDISRFADDSVTFAKRLLEEAGLAATPGVDFDPVQGHRFVRFSFAITEREVADALRRLEAWLPRSA